MADRIVFLDGGLIVEEGAPGQVLDHPVHERTRAFLSKVLQKEFVVRKVLLAVLAPGLAARGTAGGEESADVAGAGVDLTPQQNRVTATKDDRIAAKVPERFRTKGELTIGGSAGTAPPLRFHATDDKTVIGVGTDIATLVADVGPVRRGRADVGDRSAGPAPELRRVAS